MIGRMSAHAAQCAAGRSSCIERSPRPPCPIGIEALLRAALDLADNWLNLSRIELTVYVDNDRAIRLYERTGFQVEGRHARYAFRDGVMVDTLAMARLQPADRPTD